MWPPALRSHDAHNHVRIQVECVDGGGAKFPDRDLRSDPAAASDLYDVRPVGPPASRRSSLAS